VSPPPLPPPQLLPDGTLAPPQTPLPPPPSPLDAALRTALHLLAREPPGPGRPALLRAALLVTARLERDLGLDLLSAAAAAGASPVSVEAVLRLHRLLGCHGDPQLRQLAFMLLQRAAGQPATLYREREDEGDQALLTADPAEPTASLATGVTGAAQQQARSGLAAASGGQARSGGTMAGTVTNMARPSRVRLGIRLPVAAGASREPGSASKELLPGSPG